MNRIPDEPPPGSVVRWPQSEQHRTRPCDRVAHRCGDPGPNPWYVAGFHGDPNTWASLVEMFGEDYEVVFRPAPDDGVNVHPTEYTVSTLPLDHRERGNFEITVAWRNVDQWAVIQRGRQCLGTALRLAREAAPKVRVNGRTFAEWEAHWASGKASW